MKEWSWKQMGRRGWRKSDGERGRKRLEIKRWEESHGLEGREREKNRREGRLGRKEMGRGDGGKERYGREEMVEGRRKKGRDGSR